MESTFLMSSSIQASGSDLAAERLAALVGGRQPATPAASSAVCLSCQVSQLSRATSRAISVASAGTGRIPRAVPAP